MAVRVLLLPKVYFCKVNEMVLPYLVHYRKQLLLAYVDFH